MDKQALLDCWRMFHLEHRVSIDRMVCEPKHRREFLDSARAVCGVNNEEEMLWALMGLRKSKKLQVKE